MVEAEAEYRNDRHSSYVKPGISCAKAALRYLSYYCEYRICDHHHPGLVFDLSVGHGSYHQPLKRQAYPIITRYVSSSFPGSSPIRVTQAA